MEEFKQDLFLSYAFEIIKGNAGGHYLYSLQEDYIYMYKEGYWQRLFEIEFLDAVEKHIPEITRFRLSIRKQIIDNFKHKKYLRLYDFNKTSLINFENYMYDPLGDNVLAHAPEYHSTIRIPYKYDAHGKCELWIKTLLEIFEGDVSKINLLQEFFGYCLSEDNNQKKALLLLGDTDTGKSTIIDIFREVMGDFNCSNVPLQYLSNPQYTPLLINKMVNIDPEVNKEAVNYEREFKLLTGGKNEKVSCNQKHIPTFEFTPKCKIFLSANIFPKITDHSSAFYQRLMVIPCNRRFSESEKNRELHSLLLAERPGIFKWAVEGLWRLKKRGCFEQYSFAREAIDELEDTNTPSNLFFEEHIEVEMGAEIEKGELFDKYKQWANKNEEWPLSASRFSAAVFKKYNKQTPKDTQNMLTHKRVWRNIKYVHFKDNTIVQEVDFKNIPLAVPITDNGRVSNHQAGENVFWEE